MQEVLVIKLENLKCYKLVVCLLLPTGKYLLEVVYLIYAYIFQNQIGAHLLFDLPSLYKKAIQGFNRPSNRRPLSIPQSPKWFLLDMKLSFVVFHPYSN